MALRDQPYMPLYVQDYLTDEKLNECSASTQGIYIKIMCIMHKSEEYGCILLEQKYKQTDNQIKNFALKLVKHLPFSETEIFNAITELLNEKVLHICEDKIYQKRMVKDNELSLKRSESGKKGGKKSQFAKAKSEANNQANSEYEYEYENEYEYEYKNKNKGKRENKHIPDWNEFLSYCISQCENINQSSLKLKYQSWIENGWKTGKDKPIKNWKSTILNTMPYIDKNIADGKELSFNEDFLQKTRERV